MDGTTCVTAGGDIATGVGRPARAALLALTLLLTAGCELEADVVVDVDRNGAGTVRLVLAIDDELAAQAADADLDVFAPVVEAARADDAWLVEVTGDTLTLSADFSDRRELAALTGALAGDLAAPELTPLAPLAVALTDDRVTVTGSAGLDLTDAVTDLGFDEGEAEARLADAVRYEVTVAVPGEVIEVSPDGVLEERSVTWVVPAGQQIDFRVEAQRPPAVGAWIWAVVGAAAAALAGVGVMLARRRRAVR